MNMETIKWEWPEPVVSKHIYRDDEFVRTATKEDALNAIDFLMKKAKQIGSSYNYTITVFRDGEFFTFFRHSMPCYGGLVKYRDSHGERYWMNPYFPRDIKLTFPEGDIHFIACYRPSLDTSMKHPYYQFIFSDESPWRGAFGSKETVIFKSDYFVLTNMEADPTVMYSMLRLGGLGHHMTFDGEPKAVTLLFRSGAADPRRLAGQKPIRTSAGKWSEGFGYTRPYNESIFKTSLPVKFEDFRGLPTDGYPNVNPTFDSTYFVTTMKEKFGVDVPLPFYAGYKILKPIEDALVKAWDYFKEQAKELPE